MRRYPVLDPPEYVDWEADPELVAAFRARVRAEADRRALTAELDESAHLALYAGMVRSRLVDLTLKRWVRQGVISKAWLGIGEEAVTIGGVHALERGRDIVIPMIRNGGAFAEMGLPLSDRFRGYLGTADSTSGGRDPHVGDLELGLVQSISPLGDMVPVLAGIGLALRRQGGGRVAMVWVGDGATKTGAFHEGVNLAAVLKVPAIIVIQNNQVALGTRVQQHHAGDYGAWAEAYGMAGAAADGNNVLDVYAATRQAADRARNGGGPTLMIVETFRMGGHATHDEAEARTTFPAELFEYWGRRDPIGLYEAFLMEEGIPGERLQAIEDQVIAEIDTAAEEALRSRETAPARAGHAEFPGISAGVRQPGLASRVRQGQGRSQG